MSTLSPVAKRSCALPLLHVVDGVLLGDKYLWGKEQVIFNLMRIQSAKGGFAPALAVFASCLLSRNVEAEGLPVTVLDPRGTGSPLRGLRALMTYLREHPGTTVHTHGFKANVVGRIARLMGAPMGGLIATSHGFDYSATRLYVYNAMDRLTGPASDIVTAPAENVLAAFPRNTKTQFIPNAIPERALPDDAERARARQRFGWADNDFVVGAMGRVSLAKGVPELIAAAASSAPPIRWAIAGVGPMQADIDRCDPARLAGVGYVSPSDDFIAGLDVYLQPSRSEGLSLSLLQAMRAGKPIVATAVSTTVLAIRDGVDGLLVKPREPAALVEAVERLRHDPSLARRMGDSARARFLDLFLIEAQAAAYDDVYTRVNDQRRGGARVDMNR